MAITHEMYNQLYKASADINFDKTELYRLITEQNINDTDDNGHTLLHLAAARGDRDFVKFLTDNNASVSILDGGDWSALRCAVESITEDNFVIQDEIIKALILKGANINETEKEINYSLLHNAVAAENLIKAQILIANGVDLTARTIEGLTARQIAERCRPQVKNQMLALLDTPTATLSDLMTQHSIFSINKTPASLDQVQSNSSNYIRNEEGDISSTRVGESPQPPKMTGK